ncbi:MAG: EAL domain-containing protein, partial [Raoultibacter sp.]
GFTLSMDDFGSGYSSLGLLKDLPVDVIKIDRSFFVSRQSESRTKTVIGMVLKMADELSIKTVAEGVEDKNQIDLLRAFGCNM